MPRSSNYGASYPDGSITEHDGITEIEPSDAEREAREPEVTEPQTGRRAEEDTERQDKPRKSAAARLAAKPDQTGTPKNDEK